MSNATTRSFPSAREVMHQAQRENFPVALRLLPAPTRRHLLAIYGFARLVDDLGDEAPGDRSALLDELEREVERVYTGTPRHPVLRQLAPSIHELGLPRHPFQALIEANRRDQLVHQYPSFEALCGYCELSANPVGHLVLHVFGAATPDRIALSDRICTALQLVEHWQDVAEDYQRGRVYLPAEDLERFGCSHADLGKTDSSPELRRLMRFEVDRARELLRSGTPLVGTLTGRPRIAVAGFAAGGHAALDAIERRDGEVLHGAPRPRRRDVLRHLLRIVR